jgi:hypothetical protein
MLARIKMAFLPVLQTHGRGCAGSAPKSIWRTAPTPFTDLSHILIFQSAGNAVPGEKFTRDIAVDAQELNI